MFMKNDYEVFAWDYSQETTRRLDVRLTATGESELEALLNLREKIDSYIFNARMEKYEKMRISNLIAEAEGAEEDDVVDTEYGL